MVGRRLVTAWTLPFINRRFGKCHYSSKPPLCIVGSGPSAFYTAQFILRHHACARVDMYEKMPAPFGLIRYGVAPDHPEVKNVINTFTEVAKSPRFKFLGNVGVGTDLTLDELRRAYAAVILAYGASVDRKMGIPGEELSGVLSAKDFVGWYNGSPEQAELNPDLNCETVAVIGMGNVAIDVARILLSPCARLKSTDIPESVIAALCTSKIRRVVIIGRRGPLQAAFSLREIRELSRLDVNDDGTSTLPIRLLPYGIVRCSLETSEPDEHLLAAFSRPRRRLVQFLLQLEQEAEPQGVKQCDLLFLRSPVRIWSTGMKSGSEKVEKIELAVNHLTGVPGEKQQAIRVQNVATEFLDCGLVIRSIGYQSVQIDPKLPFDHERGVIQSKDRHGRVANSDSELDDPNACPLYCTGWVKRGAVGLIVDTAIESRDTAQTVLFDLASSELNGDPKVLNKQGFDYVDPILKHRGVRVVTFADWERVDALERSTGKYLGKPREKFISAESILKAAFSDVSHHKL